MPSVGHMLVSNPLVEFLRTYGPTASAGSIWDEHVVAEAQRAGIEPIKVESGTLADLLENFHSPDPVSVVLTGTAGDGKTWLCRRTYVEMGGDPDFWEASGPLLEMPLGERQLVIVKDLSQFYGKPDELAAIQARLLPSLTQAVGPDVFLVAANDGQLLRFWRSFAEVTPAARPIEERIRVMLKEEVSSDPSLRLRLHNLSRQPHDKVFENVVTALAGHPDWKNCDGCALLENSTCPIRRNLSLLANPDEPGMRQRLRSLIRLAAYNDSHLPIRHVLLLAVNIILGVSGRQTTLMRCRTAQSMVEEGVEATSSPYDNVLGLNLPNGTHSQYRAFTVFEDMGIGRETNNTIDGVLVEAQPPADYATLVASDPVFGTGRFDKVRTRYQRGILEDFAEFQQGIEAQRRRLFFLMPRKGSEYSLDPWKLTVFTHGGEYLDFATALAEGRTVDFIRPHLVVGLNRSYTGAMCDESQQVWFASPAANTQSKVGRVLDVEVPVGRSRKFTYYFDFDCDLLAAHRRPRMVVRLSDGTIAAENAISPLLFEYLLRVRAGSLPGSFSRQCYEELRHFRLRVSASLSSLGIVDLNALDGLKIIRSGSDGVLRQEAVDVMGSAGA